MINFLLNNIPQHEDEFCKLLIKFGANFGVDKIDAIYYNGNVFRCDLVSFGIMANFSFSLGSSSIYLGNFYYSIDNNDFIGTDSFKSALLKFIKDLKSIGYDFFKNST